MPVEHVLLGSRFKPTIFMIVGVRSTCEVNHIGFLPFGDLGTTDDQGDVDVFFEHAFLSGSHAMLADVIPIVGAVDDVRVVQGPSSSSFLTIWATMSLTDCRDSMRFW